MSERTVYEARVAVLAAGLDQRPNLLDSCCVVGLKHEEIGSDLLLQEVCSGWRSGAAPVYSDTAQPFRLLVGDGDLAAVSDASLVLTLYVRLQRQRQAALFSCLAQPVVATEVLLEQELPLQQVLMAASMSIVHKLQVPGGGSLLCEIALSHPQHGNALLAALSGGLGLQVVDQEERLLLQVQAVRTGPQRTCHEAKRRQGVGASSWVATDAATGQALPGASPAYELQVIAASSTSDGGCGSWNELAVSGPASSAAGHCAPLARCHMDPGSDKYSILVHDNSSEAYSTWATLAVQQLPGQPGRAALQLCKPAIQHMQLSSRIVMPTSVGILASNSSRGGSPSKAQPAVPGANRVHPHNSSSASSKPESHAVQQAQESAAGLRQPLSIRYELRQAPAVSRSIERRAAGRNAEGGSSSSSSSPRCSLDTSAASDSAAEPLAAIIIAPRQASRAGQKLQQAGQPHTTMCSTGEDDVSSAAPVFVVELSQKGKNLAAGVVCLAAVLAELT